MPGGYARGEWFGLAFFGPKEELPPSKPDKYIQDIYKLPTIFH